MGETGCGKTRLVKFLCALQTPRNPDINTMVLVKVWQLKIRICWAKLGRIALCVCLRVHVCECVFSNW
jgi:hypothetical protein